MESNFERLNKLPYNAGDFFSIQSKWTNENVFISIYQPTTNKSFEGELSNKEIEETAKELEISLSAFRKEIISALTTHLGLPAYSYELDTVQKKLILNKKAAFTIKYLDIKLRENPNITSKMLEAAIDFINEQKQQNLEIEELKEKVQENYKATCEAFEKCLEEKRNMESELLKKFTLLLNSKKDKIAELQEILTGSHNDSAAEESDSEHNDLTSEPSTSAIATKAKSRHGKYEKSGKVQADNHDDVEELAANWGDDDFLAPTQVLTQLPTDTILSKRKNSDADDVDGRTKVKRKSMVLDDDDVDSN